MSRLVSILVLLFALLAPAPARAQTPSSADLIAGRRLTFESTVMGASQSLMVYTPADYDRVASKCPVLYLLDTETNFYFTTGIVRMLAVYDLMPRTIVVGISSGNRNRDFIPTAAKGPTPMSTSPGADTFLTYIEKEVFPLVERTYRTEPYRTLIGHSFGGLLAVHAMVTRPDLFNAYVSISPSLWWNDLEYVGITKRFFEGRTSFKKYLFMSIADEGRETSWPMLKQIEGALAARPPKDLRFDFRYYADENHATTAIESTLQALKLLYGKWQVPWAAAQAGPEAIAAHFTALSAEFGYTIPVTERVLTQTAASLMQHGQTATAIRVYEFAVAKYPNAGHAYMALADAYLKTGDRVKARTCLQRLLTVNPQHAAALKKLAELNGGKGDLAGAA